MQQTAIVHTEQISRKGEIKYFQIPLPGTTKKIIAVEASAFVFSSVNSSVAQSPEPITTGDFVAVNAVITNPTDPTYGGCPNPGKATIELVLETDTGQNGINMQIFQIGAAVNPGFKYMCVVYSVIVMIVAAEGDTPESIASKLADEVNNTSLATWNQYGGNNQNYKPTATANGDQLTLTVDYQHSFFASAEGECPVAPPPPPPPPPAEPPPGFLQYDPLFFIVENEKAGSLSLQSPDATDIFIQCEAYGEDGNIGYGDFTMSKEISCQWLRGKKRYATEILIHTESPMLEAYYKDAWGEYHNKDLNYQLNIIIWYEKNSL